jgi:hypothetical protein
MRRDDAKLLAMHRRTVEAVFQNVEEDTQVLDVAVQLTAVYWVDKMGCEAENMTPEALYATYHVLAVLHEDGLVTANQLNV